MNEKTPRNPGDGEGNTGRPVSASPMDKKPTTIAEAHAQEPKHRHRLTWADLRNPFWLIAFLILVVMYLVLSACVIRAFFTNREAELDITLDIGDMKLGTREEVQLYSGSVG
jgi:hypothetical protein